MNKGAKTISTNDVRDITSTQAELLGAYAETVDGRGYRYAGSAAVAIAVARLCSSANVVANHINRTATAMSAGATAGSVAIGNTAATQDQYAGGLLVVNASTGGGTAYRISGNSAAAGNGTVQFGLEEPIQVALTTASKVSLIANPYSQVIVVASTISINPVGVPNVAFAASSFGWLQRKGLCSVLNDGVVTKGAGAIPSDAVDGAVEIEVTGTVTRRVGIAPEATVDTEFRLIELTIE